MKTFSGEKYSEISKLTPYELFVNRWALFIIAPCIFAYHLMVIHYNPDVVRFHAVLEVFVVLLLISGALSYSKNKMIVNNYAWIAFVPILMFDHYILHLLYLNQFSADILLASYVLTFTMMVLASSRVLMILFSGSHLIHIYWIVIISDLEPLLRTAVLMSMTAILVFSFIVLNGFVRYRTYLKRIKNELGGVIETKTKSLEERANQLAEKNNELEQFAYIVSHDLKTPLRNIYTISHWLADDYPQDLNDEVKKQLSLIKDQTSRMDKLIDGILNYSLTNNIDNKDLTLIDISTIVEKVKDALSTYQFDMLITQEFPDIVYNETQITQVFQNLIENAVKYNDKPKAVIQIGFNDRGDKYEFYIKDNGPGIANEHYKRIFNLFQRLVIDDENVGSQKSLGIGLSTVKKIIISMGGEIWLESELGEGTTFYFTILKRIIN